MSSQIDESEPQHDFPLSPDELFGLAMVEWRHIDEARIQAPANMLQEYRSLLAKGADPNAIVLGQHIPCNLPTKVRAHRLLYSDMLSSLFLERRRIHAQNSSQDTSPSELRELESAELEMRKSTSLARHVYHVFHPLSDAACCLDHRRIALLMEYGANLKDRLCELSDMLSMLANNPFLPAVRAQDEGLVRTLIKLATPSHGLTLLWTGQCLAELVEVTTRRSHAQICIGDMLLQYGAVINCVRFLGERARPYMKFWLEYPIALGDPNRGSLQIATGGMDASNLQQLIDHGADVNARDVAGMSPLLEAVYYGHPEAVRILLSHGANARQKAGEQVSPSQEFGSEDRSHPVREFAYDRRLFDVAAFVHDRWSALHIAAQRGFSSIAKLLLLNGADIATRERTGRTALDIAVQCANIDTAFMLICVTSSFEAHPDSGARLMASAIESRNFDVIKILMDHRVPLPVGEDMQERFIAQIEEKSRMTSIHVPQGPTLSFWRSEQGYLSNTTSLCWACLPKLSAIREKMSSSLKQLHQTQLCRFCQLVDDCKPTHSREDSIISWYYNNTPKSGCRLLVMIDDTVILHKVQRITGKCAFTSRRVRGIVGFFGKYHAKT